MTIIGAILTSIVTGGQARFQQHIEEAINKLISYSLYNVIQNPSTAASSNPLQRGSRGCGMFVHQNHAARQENGSSWLGYLCDVCFASKKSSEREFFVPAGTHLGVQLLIQPLPPNTSSQACMPLPYTTQSYFYQCYKNLNGKC
jgi:hypothetical protein